jgi:Salmonella virulence plasmid 65kDa B protein
VTAPNQPTSGAKGSAAGQSSAPTRSAMILPKSDGAIRGIGEKFATNPVTGTGSISLPLAMSPGQSGFEPQLAPCYDSASGKGPFGLGWKLLLPAVTQQKDKGLPNTGMRGTRRLHFVRREHYKGDGVLLVLHSARQCHDLA